MFEFLNSWKRSDKIESSKNSVAVSKFLFKSNEVFKSFLNNWSWFVYSIAALLILSCIYLYIYNYKRRLDLRRRRENFQRANERVPQRRRPGGIYRDHEIFRNAVKTVRQYIGASGKFSSQAKPLVLKRTRSGLIYGSFSDND